MRIPTYKAEDVIAGRFRVASRIGGGEASIVYSVREIGTERVLALKAIVKENTQAFRRLRAEYDTLSKLNHRNVVKVHEWGEDEVCAFFTMDKIEGTSLFRFITGRLMTVAETLELFKQVVFTVAYLHDRGIVHRDLTPGNILVSKGGTVTLIDFGICRSPQREVITAKHDMTGTLQFVSPEMAAVMLGSKDPRLQRQATTAPADVYALGVLLYRLLTGRWPHGEHGRAPAARLDYLKRVAKGKPARSEFMFPGIGLVATAMLAPVEQRPATAMKLLRPFEDAVAAVASASLAGEEVYSPLCANMLRQVVAAAEAEQAREEQGRAAMTAQEVGGNARRAGSGPAAIRGRPEGFHPWEQFALLGGAGLSMAAALLIMVSGGSRPAGEALVTQTDEIGDIPAGVLVVNSPNEEAAVSWDASLVTTRESAFDNLLALLVHVNLITGPVPGQKRYPCNGFKKHKAWKGGCWYLMLLEGADKAERVAACKTTDAYEPEKGFCEKSGGFVYVPAYATEDVKPPSPTLNIDAPAGYDDPNGHKAVRGSGK